MLSEKEISLLQVLASEARFERFMSVADVAARLGVSGPMASQRLRQLERQGHVERRQIATARGRRVLYIPRAFIEVAWSSPADGIVVSWTARGEQSWEFPLVSQMPDPAARSTLFALLRELRAAGVLDASQRPHEFRKQDHLGLTLVAYGSTARGTARAGSDLDLVVLHRTSPAIVEKIEETAAEVSLHSARPIQTFPVRWEGPAVVPASLAATLQSEGIIVHDGLRERAGGPSPRLWSYIYGGRTSGGR